MHRNRTRSKDKNKRNHHRNNQNRRYFQHNHNRQDEEDNKPFDPPAFCQEMVDSVFYKAWDIVKSKLGENSNIFSERAFLREEGEYFDKIEGDEQFRMLSYNLLADHLVKPENYMPFEMKYVDKEPRIAKIFE